MRKLVISLAVAVVAVVGLLLLLPIGKTDALAAMAPVSPTLWADPQVKADGGPYVKFEGAIEDRPSGTLLIPGDWRVGGITVTVDMSTTLDGEHGPPVIGAWVEVEGWLQTDGSVLAAKIETKRGPGDDEDEFEFKGVIEHFPSGIPGYIGIWRVSGISFTVDLSTIIKGTPEISAVAEVEALRAADGTLTAKKVEIKDKDDDENEREWKGSIDQLGAGPAPRYEGEWVVGGISVTVDVNTELKYTGSFTVGDWVKVEAHEQPDGSFLAHEIEIKDRDDHDDEEDDDVKFHGIIQHVTSFSNTWPITWRIGNLTVWLTGTTIVDESKGPAVVGAWAEVEADNVSGQLWARKIEVEHAGDDDDKAEIKGLVTGLSPLVIAGQEIVTDANTVIRGTPALSVTAEAEGRWVSTPTLHLLASRVEFKGDDHGGSHYEIEGTIASLPAAPSFYGTWVVTTNGGVMRSFKVITSTDREFEHGDPMVGCWVEAETVLQDGVEVATEVEVEHCGSGGYFEHEGIISQLGAGSAPRYEGEWIIGGVSFTVVPTTFIDTSEGIPTIGGKAEVKATGSSGQWIAFKVEIKEFDDDDDLVLLSALSVAADRPGAGAINVSNTSGHSRVPDLVIRANGDHHLVWEESDGRVYHSWKVEGGLWSLPMPVSTGSRADLKEVAGVLYLVWSDDDGSGNYEIYVAQWDADQGWSAPKNVSRTSGQSISPDISADGSGSLHFAWADNTPGYWVIYHGTLSANAPVPSAQGQAPHMSVAGDDTVHLTWQDSSLSDVLQVYYSRFDGAAWSLPQDISHSDRASTVPNVTLDGDENPHLVWEEMQTSDARDIHYAGRNGGAWSSPMALVNTVADSFLPEISFGGDALHVAWTEAATASTNPRLLYRKLSDGSWSALQTLLSNGDGLSEAYLDADASGKVHIAWANYTSSGLVNPTWDWDIYYGAGHLMTNQVYLPLVMH